MHQLLIKRGADGGGKRRLVKSGLITFERRTAASLQNQPLGQPVKFHEGETWSADSLKLGQNLADDSAALFQIFDVLFGFN